MQKILSAIDNSNLTVEAACVACSNDLLFFGDCNEHKYYKCVNCDSVQLYPMPTEEDLVRAYQDSNYATHEHGQGDPDELRTTSKAYYESFVEIAKERNVSGLVLDYGCGWGGLTECLIKNGFEAKGLEMSQDMVDECKRRGLPVESAKETKLSELKGSAKAVLMCGVFEHLSEHDNFLQEAYQALDDDGLFISLQPTSGFALFFGDLLRLGMRSQVLPSLLAFFDPPWHTCFTSVEGMKSIALRNNFELIDIKRSPQGNLGGLVGAIQSITNSINTIGWNLFKTNWPLSVSHTFIFKKINPA